MGIRGYYYAITTEDLVTVLEDPSQLANIIEQCVATCYLDKAWHGIHYLLTGAADGVYPPPGNVICGGAYLEIPAEDDDVDPPFVFDPDDVEDIWEGFQAIPLDDLMAHYNPADMETKMIYPSIWVRDGAEALDYLLHYYEELVEFFDIAHQRQLAVVGMIG